MDHGLIIALMSAALAMIAIAISIIFIEERNRRERKKCYGTLTYVSDGHIYFSMKDTEFVILETLKDGDVISVVVRRK